MRLVDRGEPGTQKRQGRYVLGGLIGRGGMAEVFAGQAMGSHGFQKPVAIKRLLPELATDQVFVVRLIGEAKLLVGMQHGNIVSVLDLARDGEDVFLVMEFVDGPSLRQLLRARGSRGLPLAITAYILQSAAAGLEFAHTRHVIHADISPSNLLLTSSGEVRVADFGIARREGNRTGVVEGKWAYMAPEQARGEPLTPRSDVFALGVVLYELVTGQHPLGRQITADERESGPLRVVPPRVVNPAIPPGIDAICMKALAHDPRERYASMKQLSDALVEERFSNGWREGASELAQLIRECSPGGDPLAPERRTQPTDHPMTIVTSSLISSSKPAATLPDPVAWAQPIPSAPSIPSVAPAPIALADRNSRRTLGVLGVAAVLGISAAIAIQLAPDKLANTAEAAPQPVAAAPVPTTVELPVVVPVPAPIQTPTVPPVTVETRPPATRPALAYKARTTKPVAAKPAPAAKKLDATLRVKADGWATVTVGREQQELPGAKFRLAAGSYSVHVRNSEMGVAFSCAVSVGANKVVTLSLAMEEKQCFVE